MTIAGESAGGFAVSTFLGTPTSAGLFKRAIPQSGAAHHTMSKAAGEQCTALLMAELNVTSIKELQAVDAEKLLRAQGRVDAAIGKGQAQIDADTMAFYPVHGNPVIPGAPIDAIRQGTGNTVDVLTGTNKDEATLFVQGSVDEEKLTKQAGGFGSTDLVRHYRAAYPDANTNDLSVKLSTDHMFRVPAIRLAEARAETGANTWMYRFDWESRAGNLKATHALEIPFAFNNLAKAGVDVFVGPGELPQGVADTMHGVWTAFIRGEDPTWPQYDLSNRTTMIFDETSAPQDDVDGKIRAAWEGVR